MAVNKFGPLADGRLSPEIGQYFYMVDSNFRTAAQGWSRADGTGPLDLWQARQPGGDTRVFYTPETGNQGATYASQSLAFTAAMDAMTNFRGDTLFMTPGAYTLAAAVTWDVPYARITGPETRSPMYGCSPRVRAATITCGVATTGTILLGADADGLEVSNLRFIPTSAAPCFTVNAVADNIHFHDFMWDTTDITADAGTEFMDVITTADAINYSVFDHFTWLTNNPMGPVFNIDVTTIAMTIGNFRHMGFGTQGTYVDSLLLGAGDQEGFIVHDGVGAIGAIGSGTVTQLITTGAINGTAAGNLCTRFTGGVGYPAATALIVENAAGDWTLSDCWLAQAAGGAGGALYTS